MHPQWCGKERRVENWDFLLNWKKLINGKVLDKDYPISDLETIFHSLYGVSYLGKIPQMPTIKLNLTKKQKIYAQSAQSQGLLKVCDYLRDWKTVLQSYKNATIQHSK